MAEERGVTAAAEGLFDWLKKKHLLKKLPSILALFDQVSDQSGEITAKVVSAFPISTTLNNEISAKIKKTFKLSNIIIEETIDKEVIGGVKIIIGDSVIDGTVKKRLNNLKTRLINT